MNLIEFSLLYALVGLGCSAGYIIILERRQTNLFDAGILILLWPLYGPFLIVQNTSSVTESGDPFLDAIQRAQATPLASLLPGEETALELSKRLKAASDRVKEIRILLEQPDFSEEIARKRHTELLQQGNTTAAATAMSRIKSIKRLRDMGDRFEAELDEIRELLAKLRIQAEVVRIAGENDDGTRDLVQGLLNRIEGLDEVMHDDPCWTEEYTQS